MGQFILKRDDLRLGLALGFIAPVLGIFIFYCWKFSGASFKDFLGYIGSNKQLVSSLSVLCLFVNVVVLTIYLNSKKDKTAKGIFAMTVLLSLITLLFKFFG